VWDPRTYQIELGLCNFYSKLSNIGPKRGKIGVFCEVATEGIVQNTTTPIFTAGGPCRMATSEVT
jgi:hypothetical protein